MSKAWLFLRPASYTFLLNLEEAEHQVGRREIDIWERQVISQFTEFQPWARLLQFLTAAP